MTVSKERQLPSFKFCRTSNAQQMHFVNFTEQAPLGKAAFLLQGQKEDAPENLEVLKTDLHLPAS